MENPARSGIRLAGESLVPTPDREWPFWNRTGGTDHFIFVTSDVGSAPWSHLDPLLDAPIKVVHFGFDAAHPTADKRLKRLWRGFNVTRDVVAPPHDGPHLPSRRLLPEEVDGSQVQGRSITASTRSRKALLPPRNALAWDLYPPSPRLEAFVARKTTLLMFAGTFFWAGDRRERSYSLGVRQDIASSLLGNVTNGTGFMRPSGLQVLLTERLPRGSDYIATLRASRFCLAPPGWGWGVRLATYALHGCIPVLVGDGMVQPFEDVLPYGDFSVRVEQSDIPSMLDALEAIPEARLLFLYEGLARHHAAFVWPAHLGGAAYALTLESLFARARVRVAMR